LAPYRDTPWPEELAQGDVLEHYEFFQPKGGQYKDTVWRPAVVLSHSCDFTKFRADEAKGRANLDRFPLLVAPLLKAAEIPDGGTRGHAQADRVPRYFHLPAASPLDNDGDEDRFIDFWFIQPAAVHELLSIKRLASMTEEWQRRLQRGLDRFFSWEDRKKPLDEPAVQEAETE
jgi:hypothetical protein